MTQPIVTSPRPLAAHRGRLLRPASRSGETLHAIEPADAGWDHVGFAAHQMAPGSRIEIPADARERLVLVLEGRARVRVGDDDLGSLGSRRTVFDGPPPPVVLAAPGSGVEVTAETDALVAIGSAPGADASQTAVIPASDVFVEERGTGQTARRVHHLLPAAVTAGHLLASETFTPAGNWSSYPPHKHDTEDPPREAYLEELYFYRFDRPTGFALQRVYTPDRELDETVAPGDRDVVLVPAGYHVVGAAAGYATYYLNVMAGPNRAWHFTVDPDHAWLMDWDPSAPRGR